MRFNQITKDAIIESFSDPKEIDLNLVKAYRARRFLDKVIGFELSPLLWKKLHEAYQQEEFNRLL